MTRLTYEPIAPVHRPTALDRAITIIASFGLAVLFVFGVPARFPDWQMAHRGEMQFVANGLLLILLFAIVGLGIRFWSIARGTRRGSAWLIAGTIATGVFALLFLGFLFDQSVSDPRP